MKKTIALTVRLIRATKRAYAKKWTFFVLFLCVFSTSVLGLAKLDLLPDAPVAVASDGVTGIVAAHVSSATTTQAAAVEKPVKIEISKIGLSATIANPTSTDIEELDADLLKGAVRYPTSAKLGETGNVVVFGHSSYLPVVGNQAYKTFNGIQKLVAGDTITVYSDNVAYTYVVRTMQKESAATGAGIPLGVAGKVLTLATCNSFGTKSDRFVVTADFVESHTVSTS